MSYDICRIEEYSPASGGKNCTVLPEVIWKRKDIVLLATGTLACVRTMYLRAAALDKLHQFQPCVIPKQDYAAGTAADRLSMAMRQAAARQGVRGIIVYLSCADLLTGLDLDYALEKAGLPGDTAVRFFKRGPLVARTRRPAEDLDKIMGSLPPEEGCISEDVKADFVPPPDFVAVLAQLQNQDTCPVLITPGGCTCCLSLGDDKKGDMKLYHTRFSDLELASGCETAIVNGAQQIFRKSGASSLSIIGSAILHMIGIDYEEIKEGLEEKGIPVAVYKCNGFAPDYQKL